MAHSSQLAAISLPLAALILAFVVYSNRPTVAGKVVALALVITGFAGGLIWAVRVSRKQDPADYVSQIRASPDLNNTGEDPSSDS